MGKKDHIVVQDLATANAASDLMRDLGMSVNRPVTFVIFADLKEPQGLPRGYVVEMMI
jgi:hypothetical protein